MDASQRLLAGNDAAPVTDGAMRSQTCVEFLHIMKEFSESSCDASEAVQRVDSLVSQDAQLLRLFPLSSSGLEHDLELEMDDDADCERLSSNSNSTDGSSSSSDVVMDVELQHDELQRWIELDLEIDHRMDVLDSHHEQQHLDLAKQSHRQGSASADGRAYVPPKSFMAALKSRAPPALVVDRKSSLAAALMDESEDSELQDAAAADDAGRALKRQRLSASHALYRSRHQQATDVSDSESKTGDQPAGDDDDAIVWGMENDGYEQDLLASIDHAVLCDRENRFLQWDLEMEAQHQEHLRNHGSANATSAMNGARNASTSGSTTSSINSRTGVNLVSSNATSAPFKKLVMASSPRTDRISKSPSNVDIVEDWNSIDFGTFQNRTVSHILSSCLHKRKLHHPYKNQVQLVNFSIPSSAANANANTSGTSTSMPSTSSSDANGSATTGANGMSTSVATSQQQNQQNHQLGGSLASSLAFGGQDPEAALGAFVPLLAGPEAMSMCAPNGFNSSGIKGLKGEKKQPKKREERKRMLLKMQETFADLEGTFTEQDLDVKGIVGPGGTVLSKLALAKLENLPLPDLANLPQDLRELKRKIEATEHKVEGTKHRHRKGGPCPRCQVQNQLRAAKRAYHKRAVAHKKLPHVAAASAAAAAAAIAASESLAAEAAANKAAAAAAAAASANAAAASGGASEPASGAVKAEHATVKKVAAASVAATPSEKMRATPVPQHRRPVAVTLHLSDGAGRAMAASLLASSPSLSPAVAPAAPPSIAPSPLAQSFVARSARPCGNAVLRSPSTSASPGPSASVSPAASSAGATSSPEAAPSPPIQHVTVSSA